MSWFIKILDLKNYEKANLYTYQKLLKKLIYLLYNKKLNIIYIAG